jgi:hypothetical protein
MTMQRKIVLTAGSLAALAGAALAAVQIAMADDRLACLPPAVIQALS